MASCIIYYDEAFISRFEKLRDMIEAGDKPALHRFLIDNFGCIFTMFQYYAKHFSEGDAQAFREADEEIKCELMRPLSYRQYQMVERSFSRWENEEDLVIWSIWDFLHDNGRIYEKKAMSSAEVCGCSMILENVYSCLAE